MAIPAVPAVPAIPVFGSPDGRIVVMILQAQRRDVLACFASAPRSKLSKAKNCHTGVILIFDSANRELSQSLCQCARAEPKTPPKMNSGLTEVKYPSTGRAV